MVDRSVRIRMDAEVGGYVRGMMEASAATRTLLHEVNTANDRTAWFAQGLLAVAPALVPIGAVAIPAITTLATQFGLAAAAAGVGVMAFNGVGDALKALNAYQLDPSVENLTKMQQMMSKIGPAGAEFVQFIDGLTPKLSVLSNTAREGLFPGVESGITSLMTQLPRAKSLIGDIASAMGQLASEGGAALAGPKFTDFFDFLERDAQRLLIDMGHTIGNFVDGLAAMASAFEPLTVTFSNGFLLMSQSFAEWAHGLEGSSSFNDFIAYAVDALPKVVDLIRAAADVFIQLAQAAAPVGDVMIPVLTDILDVVAKLADTPLGSMFIGLAAALSIYGRAEALMNLTTGGAVSKIVGLEGGLIATTKAAWAARPAMASFNTSLAMLGQAQRYQSDATKAANAQTGAFVRGMAPAAAAVGLLALSMSDLDDKAGMANETMLALTGLMVGGPIGAGIGAIVGSIIDLTKANDGLESSINQANAAMASQSREGMLAAREGLETQIDDVDQLSIKWYELFTGLTGLLHSDVAGDLFSRITGSAGDAKDKVTELDNSLKRQAPQPVSFGVFDVDTTGAVKSYMQATRAAERFAAEVSRVNRVLEGRANLRDYQQALDDFTKAVKQNGHSLDITTQKGRNVQAALDGIAGTALKAAENMKPLQRQRLLAQARKDLIDAAMKLGKTREQAERLADKLLVADKTDVKPKIQPKGIPQAQADLDALQHHLKVVDGTTANPKVDVNTTQASYELNYIQQQLNAIKSKTITVNVEQGGGAHRHWRGGFITGPGTGTSDDIDAKLSNGEFVVNAAATARNLELLRSINAQRFAAGGLVTQYATPVRGAASTRSVDVIRTAVRIEGPVALTGRLDVNTGRLMNATLNFVRQEIDDNADFDRMMARR